MKDRIRVTRKVPIVTRIAQRLRHEIETGRWAIGTKLPPVRTLAERFSASLRSVHLALGQLESEGYLELIHGSGTYVKSKEPGMRIADLVVLCMETTGHLYGDFASLLSQGLLAQRMFPLTADIACVPNADKESVVQLAATGGAPFFIAHVNGYFPAAALQAAIFRNKTLIGVLDWATDLPFDHAHRIVVDHAEGGNLAARHLAERGHRHVLVAGPVNMINELETPPSATGIHGRSFATAWRQSGGTISTVKTGIPTTGDPVADDAALQAIFQCSQPPTAVFGLMDAAAWACRQALLKIVPERLGTIAFLGYGNTPWSNSATPPFSSVDWNLAEIVQRTLDIIRQIRIHKKIKPALDQIPPKIILR